MTTEAEQLNAIRERIDSIDEQLQDLLNARAAAAAEVARIKQKRGRQGCGSAAAGV